VSKIIRTRAESEFTAQPDDDMIICRCEEITKGEIRRAVHEGLRTTNEIKRWLRTGMGLCQGQTCQRNVQNIVARELGLSISDLGMITGRAPVRPVTIEVFANDVQDVKE
jgi:NAD(P)H-nitrite reductase large subunit